MPQKRERLDLWDRMTTRAANRSVDMGQPSDLALWDTLDRRNVNPALLVTESLGFYTELCRQTEAKAAERRAGNQVVRR